METYCTSIMERLETYSYQVRCFMPSDFRTTMLALRDTDRELVYLLLSSKCREVSPMTCTRKTLKRVKRNMIEGENKAYFVMEK